MLKADSVSKGLFRYFMTREKPLSVITLVFVMERLVVIVTRASRDEICGKASLDAFQRL